jgi:hypothetical protein
MSAENFKNILYTPHGPNGPGWVLQDGTPLEEAIDSDLATDENPFLQAYIDIWKTPLPEEDEEEIAPEADSGQIEDENLE